ncbi:hypothetical protein [Paenibacillus arenilitoris]|uniref:Uncharacterized protein n=1 Tax=Paenibacillus arenilitoris TaxID=2772299 RepID=A0A927H5X5_9BACL|nr:hypothetical protein [Paenibacillus arenilitoris]MBD2868892.1 hypothetical protein [Paenibacillus arenilitoris]
MNPLSDQTKEELLLAFEGKKSSLFVFDGKLVSVEVENFESFNEDDSETDLAQEIEEYPELKASLQRYLDNPDMKGDTANELKEKRRGRRT